ncbi:MAG: TIGR03749 family integrating conjugative element protein [Cellvibrionaceae bacterium]|nr:TIGR03749 family integrating conjugative element protein [Cellvibrionaceae bacterium]
MIRQLFHIVPVKIATRILVLMITSIPAHSDTKKVWDELPIPLHLRVGHEVRIIFPTAVDLQVPVAIATRLQSLAPNPSMVYWKPLEDFETARVIASSLDGKAMYVLDLSASQHGLADNVMIEDPTRVLEEQASMPAPAATAPLADPREIILTRYASQTLYAPTRLMPSIPDIMPLEAPSLPVDFPLMRSSSGEHYRVEVVAQWLGYERYITAVLVANLSPFPVPVKMENVRGNFSHATAQHLSLGPAGTLEDRTTIYLISKMPFQEAVLSDGYDY